MAGGTPAVRTPPPAGCGLIDLLRDGRPDSASSQVAAVVAGGVRLIPGHRVRPAAGAPDRAAHSQPFQDRDELWTVAGLAGREDERQRAAAPVGGQMDLAGQPASGTSQFSGLQARSASSADPLALAPRVGFVLPSLRLLSLRRAPFSDSTAVSRAANCSGSRAIPAAW